MKKQILSVFLTSMLMATCIEPFDQCSQQIGVGRTAVITAQDGTQTVLTADDEGYITFDCDSRVSIV